MKHERSLCKTFLIDMQDLHICIYIYIYTYMDVGGLARAAAGGDDDD